MRVALAQINTTIGDFRGNAAKIIEQTKLAKAKGADLVVFPELAVTGYPPRDLLERPYFIKDNIECLNYIARNAPRKMGIIVGFVAKNKSPTGKGLFNSAAFIVDGRVRGVQHKALLPTYDVFDEARYFEPGRVHKAYTFKGLKIGITICEDIWSTVEFGGRRLYQHDPVKELVKGGARVIINLSSSPFVAGKGEIREKLLCSVAKRHKLPVVYVNLEGGNDELLFDGRSMVVNGLGKVVHECKLFEEDLYAADIKEAPLPEGRKIYSPVEEIYRALIEGLKDYMRKCGFRKAIVGLSGGIDSALTAALAVKALGASNVMGISMPSIYTSQESVTDAKLLADNLGIELVTIPINDIYNAYVRVIDPTLALPLSRGGKGEGSTTLENIQARIRGNILMAISNKTGALVLSTGNKSELAVGYCTLYGDMAGGLAVIADVPKMMVYELARFINREKEIIPRPCFTKPPSAELRPNQTDQDTLPPYEVLDKILKVYIEDHLSAKEIAAMGFDKDIATDVIRRIDLNEYKRRQAPPTLKVTSKAFGAGRRQPIAWRFS